MTHTSPSPAVNGRLAFAKQSGLRTVTALLTTFALALSGQVLAQSKPEQLRIGFQKSASLLTLQKSQGTLEKRLAGLGVGVKWVEFPAGPQLLEGLNVGAVDVGFVGEAPPFLRRRLERNSSTSATIRKRQKPRPSSFPRTRRSSRSLI
jgi:sulfonate transport system substrate-binding protein